MKKILINGIEINYIDNEAKSEMTLLFLHGNSHSSRTFRRQFQSKNLNHYRMIAIDLPGHGYSDPLEEYSVIKFAEVLRGFCQKMHLDNLILIGHSLGGHVALQALDEIRPDGILIFGTPPLSHPLDMLGFKENQDLQLVFQSDLTQQQIEKIIRNFYTTKELDQIDIEDFKRTHKEFRPGMFKSLCEQNFKDEREILSKFNGARAIVHGIEDKLIDMNPLKTKIDLDHLWQGRVIELNSSHNMHLENSDEFNNVVKMFADATFDTERLDNNKLLEFMSYDN